VTAPLLEVVDLHTHFVTRDGTVRAVDGVSFSIDAGRTLAVVGESGCGKSVTAMSILRLLPSPPARHAGVVRLRGTDLMREPESALRRVRGNAITMIFQEPMSSLNPVLTIGRQIRETLTLHRGLARDAAQRRAIELLEQVRIPEAARRIGAYPHQLSGGMRQRVMIAMALACDPALLIADEPTTALDVTIQAQILELLRELQRHAGAAILLITHDLGVVAELADAVVVMYAGRSVEQAPVDALFARPRHPYTRGLLAAVPRLGASRAADGGGRLVEIAGQVPSLRAPITGCAFAPRCARASDRCRRETPVAQPVAAGHEVACHHPLEAAA